MIVLGISFGYLLHLCIQGLPKTVTGVYRLSRRKDLGRQVLVQVLTALLFLWCYRIFGLSIQLLQAFVLTAFLIVISFIDYDHQLILNHVLICLAILGLGFSAVVIEPSLLNRLAACLLGGAMMLLIAVISRGGMGGGDIKFIAVLGLWLGLEAMLLTLVIGFLLGGIVGGIVLLMKLKSRKDLIAYGPFFAIGAFISSLYGSEFLAWFMKNH